MVDAIPEKPGDRPRCYPANRAKKQAEQLKIGQRVLDADPEGAGGYNAFVNEPAEASARVTLDETANTAEFMADNARIQNNVGTLMEGRDLCLIMIHKNCSQELMLAPVPTSFVRWRRAWC